MLTLLAFHHWNMSNLCLTAWFNAIPCLFSVLLPHFLEWALKSPTNMHCPSSLSARLFRKFHKPWEHTLMLPFSDRYVHLPDAASHRCQGWQCVWNDTSAMMSMWLKKQCQGCPCVSHSNVRDVHVPHTAMWGRSSASQSNIRDVLPHKAMPGMYMSLKKQSHGCPCASQSNTRDVRLPHNAMSGIPMSPIKQCQ